MLAYILAFRIPFPSGLNAVIKDGIQSAVCGFSSGFGMVAVIPSGLQIVQMKHTPLWHKKSSQI